jgi:hypothetical protein
VSSVGSGSERFHYFVFPGVQQVPNAAIAVVSGTMTKKCRVRFKSIGNRSKSPLHRATLLFLVNDHKQSRGMQRIDMPVQFSNAFTDLGGHLLGRFGALRKGLQQAQFQRVRQQANLRKIMYFIGIVQ